MADWLFQYNPVVGLAIDYMDNEIWNFLNTSEESIPFSVVLACINDSIAPPGRPIEETVKTYALVNAWKRMLGRVTHQLSKDDIDFYARALNSKPCSGDLIFDGSDLWGITATLWKKDRRLAFISANHSLIHDQIGLLLIEGGQGELFSKALEAQDKAKIEDEFIARLPGGFTNKELREERHD